jgi:hypothetical protein
MEVLAKRGRGWVLELIGVGVEGRLSLFKKIARGILMVGGGGEMILLLSWIGRGEDGRRSLILVVSGTF